MPGSPSDPASESASWSVSTGLIGLLLALVGTFVLVAVLAGVYAVLGSGDPADTDSFEFAAIAAQSIAFVGAVLIVTDRWRRLSLREFGFRPFTGRALLWAAGAMAAYFVLSAIYITIAQPPTDDLPQELGADKSTTLAIITGLFVIGVAPPIEEFFFRGFLYQALRNRLGVGGGAVLSGLLFGVIHLKPEYLVPLAILGTILALLFQKTNSLWPCILVHGANNALAFAVSL